MLMTDSITAVRSALANGGGQSSDFDLNPNVALPAGRKLRSAAVLVPLIEYNGRTQVVLTKRSSALKHPPGQIAFPGGKQDETDPDVTATALREAWEEIGLVPDNVEILGTLPSHETVTSFTVTPVVGRIRVDFDPVPEPGEVDEVFLAPFDHVMHTANYVIESRRWRGQPRYYYAVPYGPYYIWGATARILRGLAERLQK